MALDEIPNKLESVWTQRNTGNQYYEQINISGSDLIIYHSSSGEIQADKISVWAAKYGIGSGGSSDTASYLPFDGNRPITRDDPDFQGLNMGTDGVTAFLEKFFFPFISASISINGGTTYYETGSTQNISINGSVTANSETYFGSGSVKSSGVDVDTFTSASSYSTTDIGVIEDKTYRTYMQVGNGAPVTDGLITSSLKTVAFLYPYLWGISTTAGLTGSALYSEMTRSVTAQGTKTVAFSGVSTYIYFGYPSSYANLTSIKDPNLFELINSFTQSIVPVTSSGLSTDWMRMYKVYQLILQADPNGNFIFT